MSYYRELKDFILQLRGGGFFLSPRDRWFLKFLEEEGYPLEVVREGIRKFFLLHPPERRSKLPLFMSFGEVQKLRKLHINRQPKKLDWKERFLKKLRLAQDILGVELGLEPPEDMDSAEQLLQSIGAQVAKRLWDSLSREEKTEILRKFSPFREKEELFRAMVRRELFKRMGIGELSLFVD